MRKNKKCYKITSIKEESSFRIAIRVPLISKALSPEEGLSKTGVIETPFTNPKSSNLRLIFPFTI